MTLEEKGVATRETHPALFERMAKRRQEVEAGPLDLGVWQAILLNDIVDALEELGEVMVATNNLIAKMESQMEKAPVGRMRPYEKTISGNQIQRWEVESEAVVGRPCTSATVYNDGGDDVWVALNDRRHGFQKVKKNESLPFDFHGNPLIERFFFYTTADGEANLRIPLEY